MYATPHSLSQLADQTLAGQDFGYLLGDFLDAFYRRPRLDALDDEPASLAGLGDKGAMRDAYLAAVAEDLAGRHGWLPPTWVRGHTRFLHRPYFSIQGAAFRATLLLESPPAFRSRNLFVTANAMSRV